MIDVCLIYLPKPYLKQPEAQAPLGLMYLASSLLKQGHSVTIKNYASLTDKEAIEKLPKAELYGITMTSLETLHANRFSKKIKEKYKDAKIVVGGPGSNSHEFIDPRYIDSISHGDGEIVISEILHDARYDIMRPVYIGTPVKDLDKLEFPARHLLTDSQGGNIFAYDKKYSEGESTIIVSSRGCAFQCAFCTAPTLTRYANLENLRANKIRFRSPENVAEEIRHVKNSFGIKQFRFSDDMFTATKRRTLELCRAIEKEDVFWRISCRVKPLDSDMLKAMYQAGCRELSFGIESFDNKVLKGLKKNASARDNVRALELSHRHGFSTRILLMIRTPFQTPKTIELNKYFLKNAPYSIVACTTFIPIPGCDVWNNPDDYNVEILDRDIDKYNFYFYGPGGRRKIDPIMKIKNRNVDEYHEESEEFRDWLEENGKLNKG